MNNIKQLNSVSSKCKIFLIKMISRLFNLKLLFLISILLVFIACQPAKETCSSITISDYRVFFDVQGKGIRTISGHFLIQNDTLKGLFTGGPVGDMTTGKRPYLISSTDMGKTWSEPLLFGQELLINPAEWEKEALRLAIYGPCLLYTSP